MYKVEWTRKAEKKLKRLNQKDQDKLTAMANALGEDPHQKDTKKMEGFTNLYRFKKAGLRISYSIYKKRLVVEIVKAGFRGDFYKK